MLDHILMVHYRPHQHFRVILHGQIYKTDILFRRERIIIHIQLPMIQRWEMCQRQNNIQSPIRFRSIHMVIHMICRRQIIVQLDLTMNILKKYVIQQAIAVLMWNGQLQ